ncbi:hypothetical protein F4677DRAFT_439176 [Hypoxylon crocopeplum]|nr:hypothetical protein F4677DRAFT_439176 [Hypoxylon crocopeplum]
MLARRWLAKTFFTLHPKMKLRIMSSRQRDTSPLTRFVKRFFTQEKNTIAQLCTALRYGSRYLLAEKRAGNAAISVMLALFGTAFTDSSEAEAINRIDSLSTDKQLAGLTHKLNKWFEDCARLCDELITPPRGLARQPNTTTNTIIQGPDTIASSGSRPPLIRTNENLFILPAEISHHSPGYNAHIPPLFHPILPAPSKINPECSNQSAALVRPKARELDEHTPLTGISQPVCDVPIAQPSTDGSPDLGDGDDAIRKHGTISKDVPGIGLQTCSDLSRKTMEDQLPDSQECSLCKREIRLPIRLAYSYRFGVVYIIKHLERQIGCLYQYGQNRHPDIVHMATDYRD